MSASTQPQQGLGDAAHALNDHGIWQDILPDVNPSQLKGQLEVRYPQASITPVVEPHRDEVQQEPEIYFHGGEGLESDAKYTLIMTDPDLMKTNDPLDKQVRHWVQPGLTSSGSGKLTATRGPHTSFLPSAPMPMTGPHRYVFILAKESRDIGTGERGGEADFKERLRFVAQDFINKNGLTVVGVTAMKVAPTAEAGKEDVKLMGESAKHMVTG